MYYLSGSPTHPI